MFHRWLGWDGRLLRRIVAPGSSPRINRLLLGNIVEGALVGTLSPNVIRFLRLRFLLGLLAVHLNMVLRQCGHRDHGKHGGDGNFAHRETPGSATTIVSCRLRRQCRAWSRNSPGESLSLMVSALGLEPRTP